MTEKNKLMQNSKIFRNCTLQPNVKCTRQTKRIGVLPGKLTNPFREYTPDAVKCAIFKNSKSISNIKYYIS